MNERSTPQALTGPVIRAECLGKTYSEGKLLTQVFDGLDFASYAWRDGGDCWCLWCW